MTGQAIRGMAALISTYEREILSISEQELFGLMAIAQKQEKAVGEALENLENQQVGLHAVVARASSAAGEMHKASYASALIIEKATRIAVEKAVEDALSGFREQSRSALVDSVNPALKALHGLAERAGEAEESMRAATRSFGWKWIGILVLTSFMLLTTIVGLSMLLVPSPNEIADLRAAVAALEAKGGKVQLSVCGDKKRLCARIDPKAEKGAKFGQEGQRWLILQGY